mmetsp:Transcript_13734/g.37136  ORF Transcript_13734/g.37136 Transcript_13734/m.37136 type:complete len:225 (-) Transcript_13734:99-773(-)
MNLTYSVTSFSSSSFSFCMRCCIAFNRVSFLNCSASFSASVARLCSFSNSSRCWRTRSVRDFASARLADSCALRSSAALSASARRLSNSSMRLSYSSLFLAKSFSKLNTVSWFLSSFSSISLRRLLNFNSNSARCCSISAWILLRLADMSWHMMVTPARISLSSVFCLWYHVDCASSFSRRMRSQRSSISVTLWLYESSLNVTSFKSSSSRWRFFLRSSFTTPV